MNGQSGSGHPSYWEYHLRQYEVMYRSTDSFIKFITQHLDAMSKATVLDAGCGGGANIFWFKKHFLNFTFTGLDLDNDALTVARQKQPDTAFLYGDYLQSDRLFGPEAFDYLFAVQFVAFVPFDLTEFVENAVKIATKGIFLTSLFSESDLEQHTTARDLAESWEGIYKIYSIPRLKRLLNGIGKPYRLICEPFEIDIDLPKPEPFRFGTYTMKGETGETLQISGYMLMPWYNIFVDLRGEDRKCSVAGARRP